MDDIEVVIEVDTSAFDRYWALAEERYDFKTGDFERQVRAMQMAMNATPERMAELRAKLVAISTSPPPA